MGNPLEEKRKEVDRIDGRLAVLLAERLAIASSMAGLKKRIRDSAREAAVLQRAAGLVKDRKLRPAVMAVYREIIRQGLRLQRASIRKKI